MPEPPPLDERDVRQVIRWLDETSDWLHREQDVATTHGHPPQPDIERNRRLYADASLMFREAYGVEVSGAVRHPPSAIEESCGAVLRRMGMLAAAVVLAQAEPDHAALWVDQPPARPSTNPLQTGTRR